ncbi:MAG: hypothetical protein VYA30_15055 [Myxococcota bacterium]|nr:hypothetical protein [Myxococcota bacterium]
MKGKSIKFSLVFSVLLLAAPATARLSVDAPRVDDTAYILRHLDWRLGLLSADVGLYDRVQVGTAYTPVLLGINNINLKVKLGQAGPTTVSASGSFYTANPRNYSDDNPDTPVHFYTGALHASYRRGNLTYSLTALTSHLTVQQNTSSTEEDVDLRGALTGTTGSANLNLIWQRSDTFAYVFDGYATLFQRAAGQADSSNRISDRLSISTYGSGTVSEGAGRYNAAASALWSWDQFNLKLGMSYGHIRLPLINVFLNSVGWTPVIDLFWRF